MLILSLQLVSLLTYRALCGPHHKPQNRTYFTTDSLRAQPAVLCQGSQKQAGQMHPNADFQKLLQVQLRATLKIKNGVSLQGKHVV